MFQYEVSEMNERTTFWNYNVAQANLERVKRTGFAHGYTQDPPVTALLAG